jgi:large subunit ribosomal protein L32e
MIKMKRVSAEKVSKALKTKAKIDSRRPEFIRSEHTRFPRLGKKWRSSKGIRSKMRLKKRSRAPIVDTGYRSPALARGLRMDGKVEVMVFRVEDLTKVEKETQVIRISGTVGARKRKDILDKAKVLDILVLNQRPAERKQAEPQAEEVEKPAVAEEEAEEETEEEEVMAEEEKKEEPKPKPKKTKSPKKEKPAAPAKEEEPMEATEEEDEEE